jgi:lipoprotein-anchoring transpeptidase ErfK/SrfK
VRRARKLLLMAAIAVVASGPIIPSASATDSRVIAANVVAGGVPVGQMTVDEAAATLQSRLSEPLAGVIVVGAAGRVYRLTPAQAQVHFDPRLTAVRAYQAGASAPAGTPAPIEVGLAIDFSQKSVQAFVENIAFRAFRPAQDAFVQVTMAHLYPRHERNGHHIVAPALRTEIGAALMSATAPRLFHVPLVIDRPHIAYSSLRRRYPTIVTVDRSTFKLRLFKLLRLVKTYGVAVGRVGLATPPGLYHVQEREVNPSWHVPNAPWAGSLAGQTIPPGPNDPLVARWLGLGNGIGIHGTNEPFSIGSRASHGCIRMVPRDVIELYPRVPLGTPVYIK